VTWTDLEFGFMPGGGHHYMPVALANPFTYVDKRNVQVMMKRKPNVGLEKKF
jgi:hypothetical protein